MGLATEERGGVLIALATATVIGATLLVLGPKRLPRDGSLEDTMAKSETSETRGPNVTRTLSGNTELRPPLPADVVRLLESCKMCFLSTFCDDHPHLSLMNFTYYASEELIILSTRRDTKKYRFIETAPNVAILVHDFPSTRANGSSSGESSEAASPPLAKGPCLTITLNGVAIIQEGATAEKYRELHAKNNPNARTFIIGANIAIFTVRVKTARICNVKDEVTFWDVNSTGKDPKQRH